MIIVKLIGGLGNQMFQYAVARHIAENQKTVLKLDISGFETYKSHKYSLWPFKIQEKVASKEAIKEFICNENRNQGKKYICEKKKFHFDPDILNLSADIYLEGSWQNEKYFTNIKEIICEEFIIKTPPAGKNKDFIGQITSCESVGLHIRRGDYISNPHTNQVHGTCDIHYYLRCIKHLIERVKDPQFFVFSDDPEWVRDNLKLSYPAMFINHNGADRNYEDLRLMSLCKHQIIANSTFSWWGAWLNKNPDKIVIAPKRWFKCNDYDPRDLIPDNWLIM